MKPVAEETKRYSIKEVAALVGRDQCTVNRWYHRGMIRGFQPASNCEVTISADEVERIKGLLGLRRDA